MSDTRQVFIGTDCGATMSKIGGVWADGTTKPCGDVFGYDEITRQYYNRYKLPVMHTETNIAQGPNGDEAVYWLWKEWANVLRLRNDGIPIVGFTWYSLTDQVDWDTALREKNGHVNPVGLFDMDRNIRPVGEEYKRIIQDWKRVLPTQSTALVMPIHMPHDFMFRTPDVPTKQEKKNEDMANEAQA